MFNEICSSASKNKMSSGFVSIGYFRLLAPVIFASSFLFAGSDAFAIWSALFDRGTPRNSASNTPETYYVGDFLTHDIYWAFNEDTGSGPTHSGFGVKTPGGDWNWYTADYHQQNGANDEWKFTSNNTIKFTTNGDWYYAGRFVYWWGTTYAEADWVQDDLSLTGVQFFRVTALSNPSSPGATANSSSQITVNWTQWNSKNVLVVRQTSDSGWTAPTGGTSYSVGGSIGSGTVVHNGSGTGVANTGLNASTTYYYKVYSVNNDYYSSGSATVSATTQAAATPTLSAVTLSSALSATYPAASSGVSFTASGSALSTTITATAQAGYEVSTSSGSGYGSSVTVASGTTVYVRLAASRAAGTYNGATAVVLSSTGATNQNVTTSSSGNTVSQKALTISGASTTNRAYDATTTVAVSGGSLVGVETGDTVTLGGSPTGTVASATVGNSKAVTVTGYSISGASSGNYSLTQPTGLTVNITKATPTISVAPTASGIKYAQLLSASTFSGGTSSTPGSYAWADGTVTPPPGTTSYTVNFTPTDTTNFNNTTTTASVTSQMA